MALDNTNRPRQTGSGFTNLQRIMGANRGSQLGAAVGQGIQQSGNQARQGLQQAQTEFGEHSTAGRLDTDENRQRVEDVLGNSQNVDEQGFKDFDKFRGGGYTGPETFKNAETVVGQAREAQNLGQQVGTQGGRQALLQRYAGGPRQYQQGQQRLDSLVLGATGGQDLKNARRSVSGLGQEAVSAEQGAREVGQQYQNQAQGFGQEVTRRAGEGAQQVLTPAEEAAAAANAADQATRDLVEQQRQRGSSQNYLSREALQQLGLNAGDRTYGVNLGEFVNYQGRGLNEAATPEELMNQQQFQKFGNLKRLMGGDLTGYDPTKVGGYQAGTIGVDKEGLNKAIATNQAKITPSYNELSNWQKLLNVYDKYGVNMDNAGKFGQGMPQVMVDEIKAIGHGGALGGNSLKKNLEYAINQRAGAQQRYDEQNKQYGGNITTDEDQQ